MFLRTDDNKQVRDRKTVRKWLEQDQPGRYPQRKPIEGKLDGYKDYIRNRMSEGCLNARVLMDEIKERGYTGSITILRLFMQPLRPAVQSKATERFETQPGQQAQVDWGHFRVEQDDRFKRLYAFVMVLGYSRAMYLEFTEDERLETLMGCQSSVRVLRRHYADVSLRQNEDCCCRSR